MFYCHVFVHNHSPDGTVRSGDVLYAPGYAGAVLQRPSFRALSLYVHTNADRHEDPKWCRQKQWKSKRVISNPKGTRSFPGNKRALQDTVHLPDVYRPSLAGFPVELEGRTNSPCPVGS